MHPNPWVVEFAAREQLARELATSRRAEAEVDATVRVQRPRRSERYRDRAGDLLIAVGTWLKPPTRAGVSERRPA